MTSRCIFVVLARLAACPPDLRFLSTQANASLAKVLRQPRSCNQTDTWCCRWSGHHAGMRCPAEEAKVNRQDKTRRTFAPSYPSDHGIARGRQEHVRSVAWMRGILPSPLRNQRIETHYRSVRLTGKPRKVNRQTAVGLVQTDFINATIPRNSPGP